MCNHRISVTERLNDILDRPEFRAHKQCIGCMGDDNRVQFGELSLYDIATTIGTWNAESMADGLNYLLDRSKEEEVFFDLWKEDERKKDSSKADTKLMAFTVKKKSRFVIICAGGGYGSVESIAEGFPTAKKVNELGYTAFVLKYRSGKHAMVPNPMDDLAQAVSFLQEHAARFNIIIEDYAVLGFSAGGHLAASIGLTSIGYQHYKLPKPASIILAYPVITMTNKSHTGSRQNLLGKKNIHNQELIHKYSIELNIDSDYPPAFIWQCDQDDTVPVENTQMLVKVLKENGVPCLYEVFQGTAHGWGVGNSTAAEGWIHRALDFWRESALSQLLNEDSDIRGINS